MKYGKYTLKQIQLIEFLDMLDFILDETKYDGVLAVTVRKWIFPDIADRSLQMHKSVLGWARTHATQDELENLIRTAPGGYLRMELRNAWRARFEKKDV